MRKLIVLALSMLALAAPAHGQDAPIWVESSDRATVAKAGISVPLSAGTVKVVELREFGKGGVDVYAQYQSADEAVYGTIFVYAPTLPDIGLTFLATDEVIRRRLGAGTQIAEDRLIPVAGVRDAGRRIIYSGGEAGKTASGAIFTRAGPWVVVVRATGPASRAAEVQAALDALLNGMTFPSGGKPFAANVIKVDECQPADRTVASKGVKPTAADALEFAMAAGPGAQYGKRHPPRATPDRLCRESLELNGAIALQIFRVVGSADLRFVPRVYALYGDAGIMVEVDEDRERPGSFYALRHGVGRMYAFGKFDRAPSVGQIKALIAEPDDQPAIAKYTSRFVQPHGNDDVTVYCARTVEGCSSGTPQAAPAKPQSSR